MPSYVNTAFNFSCLFFKPESNFYTQIKTQVMGYREE